MCGVCVVCVFMFLSYRGLFEDFGQLCEADVELQHADDEGELSVVPFEEKNRVVILGPRRRSFEQHALVASRMREGKDFMVQMHIART